MFAIAGWLTVIWSFAFELMNVPVMFLAASASFGVTEQCPLAVMPVIVTLSDCAAVVVKWAGITVELLPSGVVRVRAAVTTGCQIVYFIAVLPMRSCFSGDAAVPNPTAPATAGWKVPS